MPQILFKTHLANAKKPTRGSEHAAGFDLYAARIEVDFKNSQLIVDTGLSVSFDTGQVLLIYGRSGLAAKHGIRLVNCTGVVDSDYRGPLKVLLRSDALTINDMLKHVTIGDRVAQAVLMATPQVEWVSTEELMATARGENGFGSTGTQ